MEETSRASAARHLSRREVLAALLLFALLLLLLPPALAAHVALLTGEDLAAASPQIVVAVVESREVRWNRPHTLLVTDYILRVEERLRGEAPERITLAVPGGTLGAISDETCLTVELEPGARYLLFLADLDRPGLTPVTGAWQGLFRELPERGLTAAGASRSPMTLDGRPLRFRELVEAARALAERTPLALRPAPRVDASLPAKAWDPAAPPAPREGALAPLAAPRPSAPSPPRGEHVEAVDLVATVAAAAGPRPVWDAFVYREIANAPIVVNPLVPGSPFSPADQHMMALWNVYAGDLFRVSPAPTAQWSYGNRVFDLAGFPDDAQMSAQFEVTWGELGSGVLGVTVSHRENGVLTEADVALNPSVSWTLDDLAGTIRGGPYPFREVMLHELGHVWGLRHPWQTQDAWWDSVMNYKSRSYYFARLYADDTTAVRSAYPPGVALRDGLVSSYITYWEDFGRFAVYSPARPPVSGVRAGGSFSLSGPIKIENTGTVSLVNPKVEVYLAPQRLSFNGAVRVKTIRLRSAVAPGATRQVSVGKIRVPPGMPPGTYFLAFHLRDPKDAYPANNSSWSNADVTLVVK